MRIQHSQSYGDFRDPYLTPRLQYVGSDSHESIAMILLHNTFEDPCHGFRWRSDSKGRHVEWQPRLPSCTRLAPQVPPPPLPPPPPPPPPARTVNRSKTAQLSLPVANALFPIYPDLFSLTISRFFVFWFLSPTIPVFWERVRAVGSLAGVDCLRPDTL